MQTLPQDQASAPACRPEVAPNGALLPALLDEVQAFCGARRGRVVELAGALGVKQPQVSAWLNRRIEPSGEVTLQIQAWLWREREAEDRDRAAKIAAAPSRLAAALKGGAR